MEIDLQARVAVLEEVVDRHDGQIEGLQKKVNEHDVCNASLPEIKQSLKDIDHKIQVLSEAKIRGDGVKMAYLTIREWMIVAIALAALYFSNFKVI